MNQTQENVDPEEIAKFETLASRWWDPAGEFRPLHDMNPIRLSYILEKTAGVSGKQVLDVGCGGGILSESLAREGATVTGIDLGEAPLAVARLHLKETGQQVDYRNISVEKLATEKQGQFDVVTCLEMLEHVPDPASVVRSCAQLVKPGGQVFFSTINRNPKSWLMAIVGAEYILGLLPRGTHHFKKLIKPSELGRWTREAGLVTRDLIGMHYNPLLRQFSLCADVDVNYLMQTIRTND